MSGLSLTHINKVLAAIEGVMEGRTDVDEYAIAGRSVKRMPMADLIRWQKTYLAYRAQAEAEEAVAAGLPNPRRVGVRFSRP